MRVVIGHSQDVDTVDAIEFVIQSCQEQLGDDTPRAGILFMSAEYEHQEALDLLAKQWPDLALIGSTTDGEMSSVGGVHEDSILLTLIVGDELQAEVRVAEDLGAGAEASVERALEGVGAEEYALCIALPHPLAVNASEVLRALEGRLHSATCPVVGGLAADHAQFSDISGFVNGRVVQDSAPLLLLGGDIRVGWGIGSGWFPIGKPKIVTRSESNRILELDGRRAYDVLEEALGELPDAALGEYPLAVSDGDEDERFFLRALAKINRESGEITCFGDVPEGSRVRVTEVQDEGILAGSRVSFGNALENYPGDAPEMALVLSCAARKWVLGSQFTEEVSILREACAELGVQDLPLAGFYCYGEIAPLQQGAETFLHNETCVTVLIGH